MDTVPVIHQNVMSKNVEHEINSEQRILKLEGTLRVSQLYLSVYLWDKYSPEINDLPRVTNLAPVEAFLILSAVSAKWAHCSHQTR